MVEISYNNYHCFPTETGGGKFMLVNCCSAQKFDVTVPNCKNLFSLV